MKTIILASICLSCVVSTQAAGRQALHGHIPKAVSAMKPIGRLAGTNHLDLAISLPLRNGDKLSQLLKDIYNPANPNFHQYLTPAQFTEQFGPTQADYEAVAAFAKAHGLKESGRHPNRLLLDVSGTAADVEKALHVKMQVYQHPTEARTFYAPDSEPSLDLATPVLDVTGLESYSRPQPLFVAKPLAAGQNASPNAGSGTGGTYMGKDFRAAYVPDTTMTGAGQTVGLLQFDGYTASDITYYENLAGLPSVTLSNVLLDGFSGLPTGSGGEVEVSLDIEMSISMAPGLSAVIVYMAGPSGNFHDILNRMATDNLAKQLSCSWYAPRQGPDATAELIFQQMAAQGQSFYAACGDYDAYTGSFPFPDDSPSIILVGGTALTTSGPGGSWVSETVWNRGNGIGTGGGISTYYPIPSYQTNISMTANLGSTTNRNIPDVALTAENVYVRADGRDQDVGGTSCASPLWAGFTALVNQRAVMSGRPTVGFINPALDTIGSAGIYTTCFHDITTGNNTSPSSPAKFYAVAGYDLCTGWGVPAGQNLINALATPDPLGIQPDSGFTAIGGSGGPFTMTTESFVLTNSGTNSLSWSMVNTSSWLAISPPGGTLVAGGSDTTPTVSLSAGAYSLPIGNYTAVVAFSNVTSGIAQNRQFALQVVPSVPPTIVTPPTNQFAAVGSSVSYNVTAGGTPPLNYQWQVTTNINGATNALLTLTNVGFGDAGSYTVTVTNTHGSTNATATLTVGYPPSITNQPQNVQTIQGSNAIFSVATAGTAPLSYQWYFYGVAMAQATNSTLTLTYVQAVNSGIYSVLVSSPFGSILSSNAVLTVEVFPIILTQPQSQSAGVGSNVTFSVAATGTSPALPVISSGTLQLWLKADAGVVTNAAGQVSQWFDQSGNANHASQGNTNLQPMLISAVGLGGEAAVRFNGIQNNVNGSYMHGAGLVGLSNAMTAFTVYNIFSATNSENLIWDVGIPGENEVGHNRGDLVTQGDLRFTLWGIDYSLPFVVPTNTYRLRTDRLDTNLDTLNVFDATATTATNFTVSVSGATTPDAGYYLGGVDASLPEVGTSRNFNGDIAELICYRGYLSESDRLVVTGYLAQKYFQIGSAGGLSYQWQFDGTNIANATNASLTLTNVQFTNAGSYAVTVSNLIGITSSSNAVLTVGYPPSITAQPQNQEVAQGTNVSFTVGVSNGTGPVGYQWYFNGAALAQATNSTLTLSNVQATNAGSYSMLVSSPFGSVLSSNAVLTVDLLPVILTQPQSQTVLVGTNVTFSVTVGNTNATPSLPGVSSGALHLWLKADTGVVTNASGLVSQWQDQSGNANHASQANTNLQPTLVSAASLGGKAAVRFNGIQTTANGSYLHGTGSVGVPNAMTAFTVYNAFTSNSSETVLWEIGALGLGQTGADRGNAAANGDALFFFWSDDYVLPFIVPTNTYRIWTDRLDTNLDTLNMFDATATSSTNFTVTVTGAVAPGAGYYVGGLDPTITGIGTPRIFNGDIVEMICYQGYLSEPDRLAVTSYLEQKYYQSNSVGNVSYQWRFDGTNIANATNATLTLNNVQLTNAGSYTVTVSNIIGATTSSNAVLMVGFPVMITNQPQNQEVVQGTNVLFTVGVSGTEPLSYQWYFDGASLAQATNSTLTLSNVQATNDGSYSVVVSSPFGSVLSSNAVLTVDLLPIILTQPQSQAVLVGTNVAFSVTAATNSMPPFPVVSSGTLRLWLKADTGVVTNSSGLVSQWQDQSGNANHASQANTNLQPTLVSAAGLGGKAAVRFNGIQTTANGSYLHGTGSVGVPNAMTAFTVYNAFSSNSSETVLWEIGALGLGQTGADRGNAAANGDALFFFWSDDYVLPFIIPTNTYRIWTDRLDTNLDTLNMFDATATSSTNFTVTVTGAVAPGAGYYVGGLDATINGIGTPRIFNGDIVEMICYQGYLSETDRLAVTSYLEQKYYQAGSSGSVTYQWRFDGTNIANATNATLTLNNVQLTNAGSYTVTVSNIIGGTTSSNAVLAVGFLPAITNQPQSQEVVQGTNVLFTVGASGAGPLNYQWYFNSMALAQATNSTLTLSNIQATNSGSYSVLVSSPFGSVLSSNAVLTVDLLPIILTQPQSQTVVAGGNIAFSVTATATPPALPAISSGTLQLWLKADAGVVTNFAGQVSQWQDQSGNTNHANQANANLQPTLVSAAGLGGKPAVRFNGIQTTANGSYLHGTGSVGVPNAMTAFTVYNAFTTNSSETVLWNIGALGYGETGADRGNATVASGDMIFYFWSDDYILPFVIPTNTYRIWTDRLDTNLDTLNMFDATATTSTNFTVAVTGAVAPGAGYYVGGLDATINGIGTPRIFNGDIAEMICYQGYLSEPDRLAVTSYLEQKYFQIIPSNNLSYQWQFDGTNIAGATNASVTLTNVQLTNAGSYSVIVSNGTASTTSSNAVLTVNTPALILTQPQNLIIPASETATFRVTASGHPRPSFRWQVNGVNVPDGTGALLVIPNAVPTDGGTYSVFVSNGVGSAVSSNAVLLVNSFIETMQGQPQQLSTAALTVPSAVQPGNTFTVSSVDPASFQGGPVQLASNSITYTPPGSFVGMDTFAYVLTPASGPAFNGLVTVLVNSSFIISTSVNASGQATLQCAGQPGTLYNIEASTNLVNWVFIGSVTAGPNGMFLFQDASAGLYQRRYYRTSATLP